MIKHRQSEMKVLKGYGEVLSRKSITGQWIGFKRRKSGVANQWGGDKRRSRGTNEQLKKINKHEVALRGEKEALKSDEIH